MLAQTLAQSPDVVRIAHGVAMALVAAAALAPVWLGWRGRSGAGCGSRGGRRWAVPALVLLLLAAGLGATAWHERAVEGELRRGLLRRTVAVAQQMNVERIRALSFTLADRGNPSFERLRQQMIAYADATGIRSLYSMTQREGRLVFGPENLAETDPMASPPGTVYERPPDGLLAVFRSRVPQTVGPYTDEYGTFVSGFAPVSDPRTGETVLLVGIDIQAQAWQATIAGARLEGLLFTLALAGIVFAGAALLQRRRRRPREHEGWLGHVEAGSVAAIGTVLTLGAVWLVHEAEARARREAFVELGESLARNVSDIVLNLRDYHLAGLRQVFEVDDHVSRDEFRQLAKALVRSHTVFGVGWAAGVAAADRTRFEERVSGELGRDVRIVERDDAGQIRTAAPREYHFPLTYIEPLEEHQAAVGFDLYSEPVRRVAIDEALRTGLATATDAVVAVDSRDSDDPVVILCAPVFATQNLVDAPTENDTDRGLARGLVLVPVRMGSLLRQALPPIGDEYTGPEVSLFQLSAEAPPRLLASSAAPDRLPAAAARGAPATALAAKDAIAAPVFACGKTYAMVARPGRGFLTAGVAKVSWATGLAGLTLTAALTALVGHATWRRRDLEAQVRARTAELTHANAALRQSYRHLQQLEQLRDSLVHMLAHDMRSPLMGITASLELALTRDQAAAAPRTAVPLRNALDSARGLTELVTAMLDVSRLEAGQMPQHRQEADMRELVMDAVRPLAPLAREHTLTQTVPDSPVLVMCDRELIRRVIANLVGNALKFTPSGGTVRVELSTTAAGARVTVADTGPGVASEDHVRIFEKFGQVAARQNGHKHSTGLGLTFCKLAVEAHGGRIGVDSELGKGSVFWFELTRGWPGPAATLNP